MRILEAFKTAAVFILMCVAGCGNREPYQQVSVSGKITYQDGSLIPVDKLVLTFLPQGEPIDARTHPRPGTASVDTSGHFDSATTHKANDGLVRGKHKVSLAGVNGKPLPSSIVGPEYCDLANTPLEVDTANTPFDLRVRKPH
jgi:hypothetical protein